MKKTGFLKWTFLILALALLMATGEAVCTYAAASVKNEKTARGEWVTTPKGVRYRLPSGKYAKNTWITEDNAKYRVNSSGYRLKGWFTVAGKKYYAGAGGKLVTDQWVKIGGYKYHFDKKGVLSRNQKLGNYYVDNSGKIVKKKLVSVAGKKYYFGADGTVRNNTWLKWKGEQYYLTASGAAATKKWLRYGDAYRYVDASGIMVRETTVGGYYVDSYGLSSRGSFKEKYVFLGDSRTVCLQRVIGQPDQNYYIAKWGSGVAWMKTAGGPALLQYLKRNKKATVFLCMGANDFKKANQYVAYYKTLINAFPKVRFYVVSVNPVEEEKYAPLKGRTKSYLKMNRLLKSTFPKQYLDCYQYLVKTGFCTTDGRHFDAQTSRKIYQYLTAKAK